jgi:hypothetical protein
MVLNFRVVFADSTDTTFRVMNNVNHQVFAWTFNKKPIQFSFDPNNEIVLKQASTVLGEPQLITSGGFFLFQNIPNPVTNTTKIVFELKNDCYAHLTIMDISGKTVASPVNEYFNKGKHAVDVDCSSFAPGVYFYTLEAGGYKQTKKMILTR